MTGAAAGMPPLVCGLGDPVMDILARVTPEWLATVTNEPGGCVPIDPSAMYKLVAAAGAQSDLTRIPGGSAANVVKGIAQISGTSARCKMIGMIGQDETGREYRFKLEQQGVEPLLLESASGSPSACAVCMVTPDGQRTMRTCLGASLDLQSMGQLPGGWVQGCRLLHCEGYCLYRPKLAREMMAEARQHGATVSIDLASFELVRNCRQSLLDLLKDGLIDVIFSNEEEAIMLVSELGLAPADASTDARVEAAQDYLLRHVKVAVTSLGSRGCVARGANGEFGMSPACRVQVVDTIGAGDFFTAGFLSALLKGASLQQCCAAGCAAGCEAVQAQGAELPAEAFVRLQQAMADIMATPTSSPRARRSGSGSADLTNAKELALSAA